MFLIIIIAAAVSLFSLMITLNKDGFVYAYNAIMGKSTITTPITNDVVVEHTTVMSYVAVTGDEKIKVEAFLADIRMQMKQYNA